MNSHQGRVRGLLGKFHLRKTRFAGWRRLPTRKLAQAASQEKMVPELRPDYRAQGELIEELEHRVSAAMDAINHPGYAAGREILRLLKRFGLPFLKQSKALSV